MKHGVSIWIASALVATSSLHQIVDARPQFVALIPNVAGPLGHEGGIRGGPLNAFGEAFQAAGNQWTVELCQADSDGDGATNGEELGDACCKWSPGVGAALSAAVGQPGEPDAFTEAQLAGMQCSEAQDVSSDSSAWMDWGSPAASASSAASAVSSSGSTDGEVGLPVLRHDEPSRVPLATKTPESHAPSAASRALAYPLWVLTGLSVVFIRAWL